jgi:putative MFS transporter
MVNVVNAGARLDRLPISAFHYRVMWLIGVGMFFDGFDIYLAGGVAATLARTHFMAPGLVPYFFATTFLGMVFGAFITGFLGDKYGRRFTYQANLALFGIASIAAAFAPSWPFLFVCRFLIGAGLGAETVVGYSTLTEFVPPRLRGKWLGYMVVFVVTGLPAASLIGLWVIPHFSWQPMFIIAGVGALIVWFLRKSLAESPRWLESVGRAQEAETIVAAIEAESAKAGALPPVSSAPAPAPLSIKTGDLFKGQLLPRMIVGAVTMIVANTLIGFMTWIPLFFTFEKLTVATTFQFSFIMALGAPIGAAIGGFTADSWGRKPTIIGASALAILLGSIYPFVKDPFWLPVVGFLLTIPVYVLVAVLIGIYVSELYPTEVRMRGSGIANTFGRASAVFTPFLFFWLLNAWGVAGPVSLVVVLLLVQIVVVATLGVEPNGRTLEELEEPGAAASLAAV